MKRMIGFWALLLVTATIFSCKKKPSDDPTVPGPVATGNVQFQSIKPVHWCYSGSPQSGIFWHSSQLYENVGFSSNSQDVAAGIFFASTKFNGGSSFTFSNIAPGFYYYKAFTSLDDTAFCKGMFIPLAKDSSFTINSGQTTTIVIY